ncbi:MFS transporter [Chloroflexota bacterium]
MRRGSLAKNVRFLEPDSLMYNSANHMNDSASRKDCIDQGTIKTKNHIWVVLFLITGVVFIVGLLRQGLPVLYPFIQDEFGLSRTQVGLITSSLATGSVIAVMLSGRLIDILGPKRIITIGMLAITTFFLAFPIVDSYLLILGLLVIIGIFSSPFSPATTKAVIDWCPIKIRASAMSITRMGIPAAGALAAAVLPALAVAFGWRIAAVGVGLLILIISVAFIFLYRDAPRDFGTTKKFDLTTFYAILRNRRLLMTMIWGFISTGFQMVVMTYFMLFLIEKLEFSSIIAGGALALAQVISIIARVSWGTISDFVFGGRRIMVLAFSGFLTILWMLWVSSIGEGVANITIYLIAIVMGISTLSWQGVFLASIGEQADSEQRGATLGVTFGLVQIGQIVVPPLFGFLVDITNSYSFGFRATAAVALICTLALLAFGRERQHH